MGERQPTAPFVDPSSDELIPADDDWRSYLPDKDRVMWTMRAVGLLVLAATVGWALLGDRFLPPEEQKVLEVCAILTAAASAMFIAAYTQRRNVDMERAYSGHLETLSRHLRSLAYRDSLTGLYNHRYFQEQLVHEVERAQRYGHLMGDTLLSYVAGLISAKVRSSDMAARYGGDEFAVILPEADKRGAQAAARRITAAVKQGVLCEDRGVCVRLNLSVGISGFPWSGDNVDAVMRSADEGLYVAKQAAGNSQRSCPATSPVGDL